MKILYISGATFPSEVSHTLSKMRMCQAFHDAGHKVALSAVTFNSQDLSSNDVVQYYGLRGGFSLFLKKSKTFWDNKVTRKFLLRGLFLALHHKRSIEKLMPDIIYSRLTITELMLIPKHLPIIYEMHSLGPLGKGLLSKVLFKYILKVKNFKRIIVTTNILADLLREQLPNIEIVVARLSAEEPINIDNKQLYQFKIDNLLGLSFEQHVGYTGYLDKVGLRGTEIICQSAAKMPETAFHVVGGEPEIVDHWKQYAEKVNPHNNIFFYGYRNPSEMPYFLECFNVVLAPLQHRPCARAPIGANMSPLKLPQYMAYKKAIVASDLPAHREVLVDEETALLVQCDDIDAWLTAIKKLLDNPALCMQMGEDGRDTYLNDYTPEGRVKTILRGVEKNA